VRGGFLRLGEGEGDWAAVEEEGEEGEGGVALKQ